MFEQVNTVHAGCYMKSGNRTGQVTVGEIASNEVIRTFQMDDEIVVREVRSRRDEWKNRNSRQLSCY
ncbi:MAG: hypothetical protein PUP91_04150 [Rhizonema sp. PD37]|nr:hypothetical protein [Rhizonema sp. PD37]